MFTTSRRLATAALLGTALMSAQVLAQDLSGTLKKIKDSGVITLGHRESSIPFSYYDDKQQVIGYSPLEAGLATTPISVLLFALSPHFGRIASGRRRVKAISMPSVMPSDNSEEPP